MHRSERLDLILRRLVDRPGITALELSRELRISLRSLYRDLEFLRKRGHPIEGSVGRGGGLRLHPSWGLGRIALSVEQSIGALLALAVAEKLGFPFFNPDIHSARRKISGAFSNSQRAMVRQLQNRIFVGEPASIVVRESYGSPDRKAMKFLEEAFVGERALEIGYTNEKNQFSLRPIEPHGLFINWPAWYLLAIDQARRAPRIFRIDRISQAHILDSRFRPNASELFISMVGAKFGSQL